MKKIWVLMSAVVVVTLAGCGPAEQTIIFQVTVVGSSAWVDNGRAGLERCSYFDGWLSAGDQVLLQDSEGEILGVSQLRATESFRASPMRPHEATAMCSWEAHFADVPVNRPAYTLRVGDFGEAVLSPESIAQGEVTLQPRRAMDVLAGEDVFVEVD